MSLHQQPEHIADALPPAVAELAREKQPTSMAYCVVAILRPRPSDPLEPDPYDGIGNRFSPSSHITLFAADGFALIANKGHEQGQMIAIASDNVTAWRPPGPDQFLRLRTPGDPEVYWYRWDWFSAEWHHYFEVDVEDCVEGYIKTINDIFLGP